MPCRATRSCPRTRWPSWTGVGGGWSPRSAWSSCPTGPSTCSARQGRRSRTTWSGSTPTSCWSRWRRRPASSTCRPATPRTRCTSAATTWPSAPSTGRRSSARAGAPRRDDRRLPPVHQARAEVPAIDSAGGVICEPNDAPLDSRHLDMVYALQTLTDKIYMGNVVSGENAAGHHRDDRDPLRRPRDDRATPATISLINCNSPLRWDDRMLDAQFEYSAANQAVVITPFLLMGAMSPVSIPAALVQQIAEALTGIALSQLDPPRFAGHLRLVPVQHRHAVRLAVLRHARVGGRSARARARSRATSAYRSAPAAASRRASPPTRSRPTRR